MIIFSVFILPSPIRLLPFYPHIYWFLRTFFFEYNVQSCREKRETACSHAMMVSCALFWLVYAWVQSSFSSLPSGTCYMIVVSSAFPWRISTSISFTIQEIYIPVHAVVVDIGNRMSACICTLANHLTSTCRVTHSYVQSCIYCL